jgi:hypothetical protein
VPDAKGKLPACVTQSLLWRKQSLAKLGLDSSAYIEGGHYRKLAIVAYGHRPIPNPRRNGCGSLPRDHLKGTFRKGETCEHHS